MDSGNSGSISSSGDEEYDDHTLLPNSTFLNHHPTQFGNSISHPQQSSLVSNSHHQTQHQHHSLFDLSSSYFHALSHQSQPNSNPNSLLNLDTATATSQGRIRSEQPNCSDPANLQGVSSSSPTPSGINQSLFPPHDNNARMVSAQPNAARNSKKRTRASRRAPTTVLITDTSNFRAMVQEFTGIPAPPFSSGSSSYPARSRRLDLLTGSSSAAFYPLRPSPQKLNHPNPFVLSSTSSPSPSTFHNNHNMVDAIASTTNISSSATTNNNYQLPHDLQGLPYHHPQNIMLSMQQNHPIQAFHHAPLLHPLGNHVFAGFGAKTQAGFEDLGMSHHGQVNADLVASHGQVTTSDHGGYGKVASGDGSCKLNFSSASASNTENATTTRGEGGTVDSWICSSD